VEEGETVTIEVSTGPADDRVPSTRTPDPRLPADGPSEDTRAAVPGVIGLSAGTASSRLRAAGFRVTRATRSVDDESLDGEVVDQAPGAGGERRKGLPVKIVVGEFEAPPDTDSVSPAQ
jgi:beta-lactam-binding protein with PASTA domain